MRATPMKWLIYSVISIDHLIEVCPAARFISDEQGDFAFSPIVRNVVLTEFDNQKLPLTHRLLDRFATSRMTATEEDLAASSRRSVRR